MPPISDKDLEAIVEAAILYRAEQSSGDLGRLARARGRLEDAVQGCSPASARPTQEPTFGDPIVSHHDPKQILIVEGNELNMKLFRNLLETAGYCVIGTANGMDALKLARQHRPDLILMDIQLPGVSGLEVARWIKDDTSLRSTPIVGVSASAMKGDEEKMRRGGFVAFLAMPISALSFLKTFEQLIGRPDA